MEAVITNHATKRTKERVGISKKLTEKNAIRALECGIQHEDTKGRLRRYVDSLYLKEHAANNVRIYCNNVYLFHNNILITVFPVPVKYRKIVDNIIKKRKEVLV